MRRHYYESAETGAGTTKVTIRFTARELEQLDRLVVARLAELDGGYSRRRYRPDRSSVLRGLVEWAARALSDKTPGDSSDKSPASCRAGSGRKLSGNVEGRS